MGIELEIYQIIKDFYNISGVRVSIHDTEFREIYAYPNQPLPFCCQLQKHAGILSDCMKNDENAFKRVQREGEVYVYRCKRGLHEAVTPIYHYGVLSGYLMMGQVRDDSKESLEIIKKNSEEFLADNENREKLVQEIPAISLLKLNSYINIMTVIAQYITGYNKLLVHRGNLPQLVHKYLNQKYSEKITLEQLNIKFGCCNATLTRSFKREYKVSIFTYLNRIRLEKAEEMLRKSRKPIKEIASDCGFCDQNYFSRLFSQHFGCSPTEYRDKNADLQNNS